MEKKPEFHGSDLEKIAEYYHIAPEKIIKFGANVNPLGLSETVRTALTTHLDIVSSYPDREYKSLRRAIGAYCGADPAHVIVGNGSTELISLLINERKAKRALVLGPAYSEYARELKLAGGSIAYYNLKESQDFKLDTEDFISCLSDGASLVILCNPNNPTSSAIRANELRRILDTCEKRGIFVMVDETYVEFAPDIQEVTAVPLTAEYENLMVIRGVSKFFAAPGLRFGYGITGSQKLMGALLACQNPWSLNSIGAYAGELMLADESYIRRTRELICTERARMMEALRSMSGVKAYEPYGNFILVRILKPGVTSHNVFEAAIREHMMIRDCSSFECLEGEYVRFCIMRPKDNDRLMACIRRAVR